jgi:MerR family transcriptional regulator, redox-sensitive transcriptional activator SoxR
VSSAAKELTVGEFSQRSGVPPSTLRFYERKGLITSARTVGNQRRYSRDMLRRVAFIRASRRLGVPLSEIKLYLSMLPELSAPTREDWARASNAYRQNLLRQISRLELLLDRLDGCIGCGCLSMDVCELVNPDDRLRLITSGAVMLDDIGGDNEQPAGPDAV